MKPTLSSLKAQQAVDMRQSEALSVTTESRHDANFVVPPVLSEVPDAII